MTTPALKEGTKVTRPLRAYVPLIQEQLDLAEKAGMPFYDTAGKLLREVREIYFQDDAPGFYAWADKNFGKSASTIRTWMAIGSDAKSKSFESLTHFSRERLGRQSARSSGRLHREWTAPVDAVAEKAHREAQLLAFEESLTRRQERDAEAKLGLRLIDIGYKVLAKELHPDKLGGSREAMARLNRVRDRLRTNV